MGAISCSVGILHDFFFYFFFSFSLFGRGKTSGVVVFVSSFCRAISAICCSMTQAYVLATCTHGSLVLRVRTWACSWEDIVLVLRGEVGQTKGLPPLALLEEVRENEGFIPSAWKRGCVRRGW